MNIVQVLVSKPFDSPFDYFVPDGMTLAIGDYVLVPFGRQTLWGVVWSQNPAEVAPEKIKEILQSSDLPAMQAPLRQLVSWLAKYTMSPTGSVLHMAISVKQVFEPPKNPRKKPPATSSPQLATPYSLNGEQQTAVTALTQQTGHHVTVIDGVTGSGKTAVYLDYIASLLDDGKQALVLLPEIILTNQFIGRVRQRFGFEPTCWHSNLTPATRRDNWKAIASGEAKLVVGARSALFLPFQNLATIIVDEEHEPAYKQEDGVAYHGRDAAVVRAKFEDIPVVLVSASPACETVQNIRDGKYNVLHLHTRFGDAVMPKISMVDMRGQKLPAQSFLSEPLKNALVETMASGQQSLLFLNRRGFAPLTLCRKCGFRFESPETSAWMVLHKKSLGVSRWPLEPNDITNDQRPKTKDYFLKCHHSGFTMPLPEKCPECDAEDSFAACGPGVERLQEEVAEFLPQARIVQMTSDTMAKPKEAEAILAKIEANEIDIIIGTQLVAKGHHFPNLTLVGVVDADLGLDGGNVRAGERTYQLLHQVAGRAGREKHAGRVLIQSYKPEHGVMQALAETGRDAFMAEELERRKRGNMPPFSKMAAVIISGLNDKSVEQAARSLARSAPRGTGFSVLGPVQAPIYKLRNRYRWRFLIIANQSISPQKLLHHWLDNAKIPPSITCKIDIDPQSLM